MQYNQLLVSVAFLFNLGNLEITSAVTMRCNFRNHQHVDKLRYLRAIKAFCSRNDIGQNVNYHKIWKKLLET